MEKLSEETVATVGSLYLEISSYLLHLRFIFVNNMQLRISTRERFKMYTARKECMDLRQNNRYL
jgi:hypothetical protein